MLKRKRDPTFSNSEKTILIDLVRDKFHIIECKKSDTVTVKKKQEEWVKIADEFNSVSSIYPRDSTVLKNCWENLKKRAKLENTLRNQNYLKTGGGPPKNDKEDPILNSVLELIQTRVSGFVNIYDSDGMSVLATGSLLESQADVGEVEVSVESDVVEPVEQEVKHDESTDRNWSEYTPAMLRQRRSTALTDPVLDQLPLDAQENFNEQRSETRRRSRPSRRRPVLTSQQDLSRGTESFNAERINTLLLCNNQAVEEHDIKIKILKLQEEKEKEILEQERLKTKQEKIKLEVLELELKKIKDSI